MVSPARCALIALVVLILTIPENAFAGLPWFGRPRKASAEWWQERAGDPPGIRQREHFGRVWPPQARPTGPKSTFIHGYYDAHYWPYPYRQQDRNTVRGITEICAQSGWMTATTLYDYHFEDSGKLNRAGRMRLQWIVQNAPAQRRHAYVQAAISPQESQARLASVQNEATLLAGGGAVPPVDLRTTMPEGRPAVEIDRIRRQDLSTILDPRISSPIYSAGSGSSTGGK